MRALLQAATCEQGARVFICEVVCCARCFHAAMIRCDAGRGRDVQGAVSLAANRAACAPKLYAHSYVFVIYIFHV